MTAREMDFLQDEVAEYKEKKMATTQYLSLIVKGDKLVAAKAAADRQIPFAFQRLTSCLRRQEVPGTGFVDTVGYVGTQHLDKVAAWFAEAGQVPFAEGTLLCYSCHEEEEEATDWVDRDFTLEGFRKQFPGIHIEEVPFFNEDLEKTKNIYVVTITPPDCDDTIDYAYDSIVSAWKAAEDFFGEEGC